MGLPETADEATGTVVGGRVLTIGVEVVVVSVVRGVGVVSDDETDRVGGSEGTGGDAEGGATVGKLWLDGWIVVDSEMGTVGGNGMVGAVGGGAGTVGGVGSVSFVVETAFVVLYGHGGENGRLTGSV